MHHQIKHIISRLLFTPGSVQIDLSAGEQTPLGRILYKVYYQTNICDVVDREHRSGYPHNGGSHTFHYHGPKREAVAMLKLIKEVINENFKVSGEEAEVLSQLSYVSQEILSRK